MRFGLFMAPFHPTGQNPTLALERDLELIEHLDRLGFHEVWIGEHHSGGYEIISSPEVFIAAAAARTKYIRLGSGVNSLPYHQPLMLADRFVLLDHLTRGRAMLGCGPGQLTSDAHMLGIPADTQRPRMDEALDAIMALLRGETVTKQTDWFTLAGRAPAAEAVQRTEHRGRGRGLDLTHRRQGGRQVRHRAALDRGDDEDRASTRSARTGRRGTRSPRSTVTPPNGRSGASSARCTSPRRRSRRAPTSSTASCPFSKYFTHVLPAGPTRGDTPEEIIANVDEDGFAVIGTPDDAIAKIESLVDESGGFGTFLLFGHDWASPAATKHSFELFAQYVMPHFTGQLERPQASCDWVTGSGGEFVNRAAERDHEGDRGPRGRTAGHLIVRRVLVLAGLAWFLGRARASTGGVAPRGGPGRARPRCRRRAPAGRSRSRRPPTRRGDTSMPSLRRHRRPTRPRPRRRP